MIPTTSLSVPLNQLQHKYSEFSQYGFITIFDNGVYIMSILGPALDTAYFKGRTSYAQCFEVDFIVQRILVGRPGDFRHNVCISNISGNDLGRSPVSHF